MLGYVDDVTARTVYTTTADQSADFGGDALIYDYPVIPVQCRLRPYNYYGDALPDTFIESIPPHALSLRFNIQEGRNDGQLWWDRPVVLTLPKKYPPRAVPFTWVLSVDNSDYLSNPVKPVYKFRFDGGAWSSYYALSTTLTRTEESGVVGSYTRSRLHHGMIPVSSDKAGAQLELLVGMYQPPFTVRVMTSAVLVGL